MDFRAALEDITPPITPLEDRSPTIPAFMFGPTPITEQLVIQPMTSVQTTFTPPEPLDSPAEPTPSLIVGSLAVTAPVDEPGPSTLAPVEGRRRRRPLPPPPPGTAYGLEDEADWGSDEDLIDDIGEIVYPRRSMPTFDLEQEEEYTGKGKGKGRMKSTAKGTFRYFLDKGKKKEKNPDEEKKKDKEKDKSPSSKLGIRPGWNDSLYDLSTLSRKTGLLDTLKNLGKKKADVRDKSPWYGPFGKSRDNLAGSGTSGSRKVFLEERTHTDGVSAETGDRAFVIARSDSKQVTHPACSHRHKPTPVQPIFAILVAGISKITNNTCIVVSDPISAGGQSSFPSSGSYSGSLSICPFLFGYGHNPSRRGLDPGHLSTA